MIAARLWELIARQHVRNPARTPHATFRDARWNTVSAVISVIASRTVFSAKETLTCGSGTPLRRRRCQGRDFGGGMLIPGTAVTDLEFASVPSERTVAGLPLQLFVPAIELGGLTATASAAAVRARHEVGSAAVRLPS